MNFLEDIYKKSLLESEKNIKFWEDYLQNLNSLDFNFYSDKLTVPILVPIGNKVLFRGLLKHTNEVTVALGADYFAKCSIKQAEVLRLRRINDIKSKLELFRKEKDYLENQISFSNKIIHGYGGQDVIEVYSEEEDRVWREKHKEKVKQYHKNKDKIEAEKLEITDEELLSRLEELELQEELQNELTENKEELDDTNKTEYTSFIIKQNDVNNVEKEECLNDELLETKITHHIPKQTSKLNLLQQVYERQKLLEEKLSEIKNREKVQSKTETDLLSRLDEIEQLDELEDEMNRLDDLIDNDDDHVENKDDNSQIQNDNNVAKITRSVSFADNDDSETLNIMFKHSSIESPKHSYDPDKGITKPSDIYYAYSHFFVTETTSILKKSKCNDLTGHYDVKQQTETPYCANNTATTNIKTIVVQDVIEKTDCNESKVFEDIRPVSLFKKKRQRQKI